MEKNYYKVMAKTQTNNTYKAPWRDSVYTETESLMMLTPVIECFVAVLVLNELLLAP